MNSLLRTGVGASLVILVFISSAVAQQLLDRPEIIIQSGHAGGAEEVALSNNSKLVASCGTDRAIKLWDIATGQVLRSLYSSLQKCSALTFSPNDKILAVGGEDAKRNPKIELWDLSTGKELYEPLRGRADTTLIFSPEGQSLFTAGGDYSELQQWEVITGKSLGAVDVKGSIGFARFTSDGRLLVAGTKYSDNDKQILSVWEPLSKRPPWRTPAPLGEIQGMALSPDGNLLAIANEKGQAQYYNLASGKTVVIRNSHKDDESWSSQKVKIIFSPDSKSVLIDGELWDVPRAQKLETFDAVAFNGKLLVGKGKMTLWNAETYEELRTLDNNSSGPVTFLSFSKDGKLLVSGMRVLDQELRLWNVGASGTCLALLPFSDDRSSNFEKTDSTGPVDGTSSLLPREWNRMFALSPDGKSLATATKNERNIKVWDVSSGKYVLTINSPPVTALAFSSDGKRVVSGNIGKSVNFWNVANGSPAEKIALRIHVASLALDEAGKTLVVGSENRAVHVLNANTGNELKKFKTFEAATGDWSRGEDQDCCGPVMPVAATLAADPLLLDRPGVSLVDPITTLSLSQDGRYVATGGLFGTQVWDATTGETVHIFNPGGSYAFSEDAKILANARGETLLLHDMESTKKVRMLRGHAGEINTVAFSPNGKILATGGSDETIRVWDLETGEELASLVAFNKSDWLVITPDGLFDGPPGSWNKVLWRFSPNPYDVSPIEAYFYEFYRPGLLSDILSGERPRASHDLRSKDRRAPALSIALGRTQDNAGTLITSRSVRVQVKVKQAPADSSKELPAGGVRDVRLFRNGSLVKLWPGDISLDSEGNATLETEITAVSGENVFTAYAFNRDNVKSIDAGLMRLGHESLYRKGTAYIIAIGISSYENAAFNLKYTVDDAREFGAELERQQTKTGQFANTKRVLLANGEATKANILLALERLAGKATGDLPKDAPSAVGQLEAAKPEDAVFLYFSGHGTTQKERFFLIPYDLNYKGSRKIKDEDLEAVLAHSISDLELETAFRDIDAGQFLFIIDACYSGQALAGESNGPINSTGLAQLAYEKGLYILAASQNIEEAFVSESLHHSYLTFVLVQEGLRKAAADTSPLNGQVTLREWFDYAAFRVPKLREERIQRKELVEESRPTGPARQSPTQTPRAFYKRDADYTELIIAALRSSAGNSTIRNVAAKVYEKDEVTQRARILSMPQHSYTEAARTKTIEGTVVLRVTLLSTGQVGNIEVINGLPEGLTERAIETVRRIKFNPARLNGIPVSQYQTFALGFRLY